MIVLSEIVRKVMEGKRPITLGRNDCIEFRYRFIEDFDTTYRANFIAHKLNLSEKEPYVVNKIIAVQFLQYVFIFEERSDKIAFCKKLIKRIEQDKEGFFKDEPNLKEGLLTIFRIEWDSLRNAIKKREDEVYKRVIEIESKVNSVSSLQKEIGHLIELVERKKKRERKPPQKLTFSELFIHPDIGKELKKILAEYGYTNKKNIWLGQTQAKNELAIAFYILKQPEHGFQLIKTGNKRNQLISFYNEFGLAVTKYSDPGTYTTERNILTEPFYGESHDIFRRIFRPLLRFKN